MSAGGVTPTPKLDGTGKVQVHLCVRQNYLQD